MKKTWWKEGIIYQIYPRSFQDSNGDGVGDLRGIIQRLDYLQSLGIDILWLSPIYRSPNDDNGYDISDYRAIMDEFGSMEDFDELLAGLHARGIRLLLDLVVNHSSDEHHWFQEARKSPDSPYRDYYIWRQGENGTPPSNWVSFFSGNAWQWDEEAQAWYLHLFTKKQPDMNWENPKLRQEVYDIMRFWLDKGIDGFRMDVIPLISKRLDFPVIDDHPSKFEENVINVYANGPRVHEFIQEMHREVMSKYDMMSVGEGIGITPALANNYVGASRNELNLIYHFGHMFMDHGPGGRYDRIPIDWKQFWQVFEEWDVALGEEGWGSIYLGNHDFPRLVSRFGDDGEYRESSAKLFIILLLTLRGTPTIYQGDEIGMTNTPFSSIEQYRDVELRNAFKAAMDAGEDEAAFLEAARHQSRDHARTPMLWENRTHGGFTEGEPWIQANPNFTYINVADQEQDPNSILNFYRKMIAFRKANKVLIYGTWETLAHTNEYVYRYLRKSETDTLMVVLNTSSESQPLGQLSLDNFKLVLGNYENNNHFEVLRPWEARIYEQK